MGKANVGRVIACFAYCFGSVIVPALIALVLILFFTPDVYLANERMLTVQNGSYVDANSIFGNDEFVNSSDVRNNIPGSVAAIRALFADKSNVWLTTFSSKEEVLKERDRIKASIAFSSMSTSPWYIRYKRSDNGLSGQIITAANHLLAIEAPDAKIVQARFKKCAAFSENPKRGIIVIILDDYPWLSLAGLFLYLLLQLFTWPRVASWAARVDAACNIPPVSYEELKGRLFSINNHGLPFEVKEGKHEGELVVEWKYADAKWIGIMCASGLKSLYRLKLKIDKRGCRVRAQDNFSSMSWSIGTNGPVFSSEFKWSSFKGISFANYERGIAYGVIFRDGTFKFDRAYNYKFSLSEVKNPVIEVIANSGWNYVPVVTFNRVLN